MGVPTIAIQYISHNKVVLVNFIGDTVTQAMLMIPPKILSYYKHNTGIGISAVIAGITNLTKFKKTYPDFVNMTLEVYLVAPVKWYLSGVAEHIRLIEAPALC